LANAETALPDTFKQEYQRITRVRGEQAMAQVDGEVCGGCYQMLTPQMMNELYMMKPLFCKSCGCLLYLSEDALNKRRK
jgi:predicted  nucleic acid-binding Zn-ribbon protein